MIKPAVWTQDGDVKSWMVTKRIGGIKWFVGSYKSRKEAVIASRLVDMNKSFIQEGKILHDKRLF